MKRKFFTGLLIPLLILLFQGCIHDYPQPVKGSSQKGEQPGVLTALIEVNFDLSWENMIHRIEISPNTKARPEHPHRFIIEVIKEGKLICRDVEYLTDDEFTSGKLSHKLSVNLETETYRVAVWYDIQDEMGEYPFSSESLKEVRLNNFSTVDAKALQCGYASEYLDLSDLEYENKEVTFNQKIELKHPGARFEIVATDIQQFITTNRPALLQGDNFTVHLNFSGNTPIGYDIHSESLKYDREKQLELSGAMRLPFADYDELKIAEGFLFCDDQQEVWVKLGVKNSALVSISQTDYFSFPIKPGYVTSVYGDFLSNPIDGIFSINNIWDGEIIIEI